MKIKFTDARSRMPEAGCQKPDARNSGFRVPSSESGIALVITLILLSVTLVMAVAFLAISRRERGSVTTETDTTTAKLAADSALAAAEAQIIVNAFTNPYNYGLLVSTNYINTNGFFSGIANPTNVSYNYFSGAPLSAADNVQNIANLFYLARAPVFVVTNSQTGATDFRFYLDLNRNGKFEDTATKVPDVNNLGTTNLDSGGNLITVPEVGDPQWIGILERPDAPHGPNNYFVARYAFIAVPIGNALDLNYIHNQVFNNNNPLSVNDGFFRNQGVGSWEINLAAFLADLNTNEWGQIVGSGASAPLGSANWYLYDESSGFNNGDAFDDARALLAYRYNDNYNTLNTVRNLFGANGASAFQSDGIDGYSDGPLQTTFDTNADFFIGNDDPTKFWAGADNTNHYFDLMSDLFDPTKTEMNVTPPGFIERLQNAGTNVSTYNRYTFYKLLAQLGTDSQPEQGKMNLNYDNLDASGNVVPNGQTNFIAWTPIRFFTNAADRMLRLYTTNWFQSNPTNYLITYYNIVPPGYIDLTGLGVTNVQNFNQTNMIPAFGITNIPVYVNGRFVYSSAIQRVLQLAANIYDATTNSFYPSIFRPTFRVEVSAFTTNIFVMGYEPQTRVISQATEFTDPDLSTPVDVANLASLGTGIYTNVNVYGVPWIVGAKKGFPNFNEFTMENAVQVTRKLQINRNTNASPPTITSTNQMYCLSVTNLYGLECWNSYQTRTNYTGQTGNTGPIDIMVRNDMAMTFTVNTNANQVLDQTNWLDVSTNIWPDNVFWIPLNTNVVLLTNSVYYYGPGSYTAGLFTFTAPTFIPQYLDPVNFLDTGIQPMPQFGLLITNHLQVVIIDYSMGTGNGRIVDYVQLNGLTGNRNINNDIADVNSTGLWSTNLVGADPTTSTLPQGVVNQIYTSRLGGSLQDPSEDGDDGGTWTTYTIPGLKGFTASGAQQLYFTAFFASNDIATTVNSLGQIVSVTNLLPSIQAAYSPTRTRVQRLTWQANDPLVHYLASDLTDTVDDTNTQHTISWPENLGLLNNRYMPWGGNPNKSVDHNPFNLSIKDPLATNSDAWDFPTSKFPTAGWLGRVHRGTPWQTVFMKATNILNFVNSSGNTNAGLNTWAAWAGDIQLTLSQYFDAANFAPTQDRLLFDLFSTAPNDNATRGQLSVNIGAPDGPSFAAWSALFSGIAVPTTLTNTYTVIQPAGLLWTNSPLGQLVVGINNTRATFTNTDGLVGTFEHVGDILATPQLTEQSPFILSTLNPQAQVSDELYEWLPQQTMSLLRASDSPRYVLYCYGQTLKPAQGSLVTSGQFFGMCTNYQITSESAVRVVLRVDDANTSHPHAVIESYNVLPPD